MTSSTPDFIFFWDKKSFEFNIEKNTNFKKNGVKVFFRNFKPKPRIINKEDFILITIGIPILKDKIDFPSDFDFLVDIENIKKINGQFVFILIDKKKKELSVFNDRFSSIPVYYANTSNFFILSFSYLSLVKIISKQKEFQFLGDVMYEFIRFQRIFGSKTIDNISKFLESASLLKISQKQSIIKKYWLVDFKNKRQISPNKKAEQLSKLLRQSMKRLTSDKKKMGLFLSGGHDSRTILMLTKRKIPCFTVSFSDNYEVKIAREIALTNKSKHFFIKLDQNHFYNTSTVSARICGGMYNIFNSLFINLQFKFTKFCDVMLHGHALDYLFQGMYLPTETIKIFDSPTFFKKIKKISENIPSFFIKNLPYRLKFINHEKYIKKDHQKHINKMLENSISEIIELNKKNCLNSLDIWESILIESLGRHYSWPNIGSKMSIIEQRTLCFDNDIFDFFLSLNLEDKINGKVIRKAQILMNSELSSIPTGNYGFSASDNPFIKTTKLILRKILRHITFNKKFRGPIAEDRTWPDRDRYLVNNEKFQSLILESLNSKFIRDKLNFLDWKLIDIDSQRWIKKPSGGATFLISLLSLHLFFKELE